MLVQTQYRIYILLIVIFASVAMLMSVCGKYWIQTTDLYSGLWETCTMDEVCKDVDDNELYWIPHVRRLMISGLGSLSIVLLYYIFLISSPKAFNSKILVFLLGLAAVLFISGMSVFTYYNNDDSTNSYTYHWAFWMGWLGIVLDIAATGMSIHDARRPSSPFENAHRLK